MTIQDAMGYGYDEEGILSAYTLPHSLGQGYNVSLHSDSLRQPSGIDAVGSTQLTSDVEFGRIDVYSEDTGCVSCLSCLDHS